MTEKGEQMVLKDPYNAQKDPFPDGKSPSDFGAVQELVWRDTNQDGVDMKRLGKKQEFKVQKSTRSAAQLSAD